MLNLGALYTLFWHKFDAKICMHMIYMEVQFSILLYTNICCRLLSAETRADLVYPILGSDPIIDTDSKTYNANLTGALPELGIAAAPFYLTAVLSPILIIIMIVAAILLLVIGQKTIVHLPFAIVVSFEPSDMLA